MHGWVIRNVEPAGTTGHVMKLWNHFELGLFRRSFPILVTAVALAVSYTIRYLKWLFL